MVDNTHKQRKVSKRRRRSSMPSSNPSSSDAAAMKKAQEKSLPNEKVNKKGGAKKRRRESCPATPTPAQPCQEGKKKKSTTTKKVTFNEHTSVRRHSVPAQSVSPKPKPKKRRASTTEVDTVKKTKNKKKSNKSSTNNKKKQKKHQNSKSKGLRSPLESNASSSSSSSFASKGILQPLKREEQLPRPNALLQRRSSLASLASLDMDALFDAASTTSSTNAQNELTSNNKLDGSSSSTSVDEGVVDDALYWLKTNKYENKHNTSLNDSMGIFRELDNMLPKPPTQTLEQRAMAMERALNHIMNTSMSQGVDVNGIMDGSCISGTSRHSSPSMTTSKSNDGKQRPRRESAQLDALTGLLPKKKNTDTNVKENKEKGSNVRSGASSTRNDGGDGSAPPKDPQAHQTTLQQMPSSSASSSGQGALDYYSEDDTLGGGGSSRDGAVDYYSEDDEFSNGDWPTPFDDNVSGDGNTRDTAVDKEIGKLGSSLSKFSSASGRAAEGLGSSWSNFSNTSDLSGVSSRGEDELIILPQALAAAGNVGVVDVKEVQVTVQGDQMQMEVDRGDNFHRDLDETRQAKDDELVNDRAATDEPVDDTGAPVDEDVVSDILQWLLYKHTKDRDSSFGTAYTSSSSILSSLGLRDDAADEFFQQLDRLLPPMSPFQTLQDRSYQMERAYQRVMADGHNQDDFFLISPGATATKSRRASSGSGGADSNGDADLTFVSESETGTYTTATMTDFDDSMHNSLLLSPFLMSPEQQQKCLVYLSSPAGDKDGNNELIEQFALWNWLRNGKQESQDPTGVFRIVDDMVPDKSPSQTPEERAQRLCEALQWLRKRGIYPKVAAASKSIAGTPPSSQDALPRQSGILGRSGGIPPPPLLEDSPVPIKKPILKNVARRSMPRKRRSSRRDMVPTLPLLMEEDIETDNSPPMHPTTSDGVESSSRPKKKLLSNIMSSLLAFTHNLNRSGRGSKKRQKRVSFTKMKSSSRNINNKQRPKRGTSKNTNKNRKIGGSHKASLSEMSKQNRSRYYENGRARATTLVENKGETRRVRSGRRIIQVHH